MDLNAGQLTRQIYSGLMQWTDCAYEESWTSLARLCQKCRQLSHYQPSPLSSITKSRCLTFFGHLARMDENADASQAIFKAPPENWKWQLGWPCTTWMKNIMMTCLRWILGCMRLEIRCKISLSGDWCLCTALCTRSGACYCWIGVITHN